MVYSMCVASVPRREVPVLRAAPALRAPGGSNLDQGEGEYLAGDSFPFPPMRVFVRSFGLLSSPFAGPVQTGCWSFSLKHSFWWSVRSSRDGWVAQCVASEPGFVAGGAGSAIGWEMRRLGSGGRHTADGFVSLLPGLEGYDLGGLKHI